MFIHFSTELQIMTVYRLEGAVVPYLIHSHIVSRVLGLSPSSVMPSESQGFQDKSYSFVQKGVMHVTKKKQKKTSQLQQKHKRKEVHSCRPWKSWSLNSLGKGHYACAYSCHLKKTPKLRQTFRVIQTANTS